MCAFKKVPTARLREVLDRLLPEFCRQYNLRTYRIPFETF
jgi:hypothetical protein